MSKMFVELWDKGCWKDIYPYAVRVKTLDVDDEWLFEFIPEGWIRDTEYECDDDGYETSDCIADIFYFTKQADAALFALKWA